MKEEKGKNLIIGALLCIIILLIAAIILLLTNKSTFKKSNTNEDNTQTVETTYTYKEIKGLYSYKGNLQKDDYGNDYREDYRLYLYENGTFIYNNYTLGPHGHIGNYIIVDNTIKLNYLYGTVGGTGMFPETGTEEITIKNDNELIFTKNNNAIVTRQTSQDEIKDYEERNVSEIIKTGNGATELE